MFLFLVLGIVAGGLVPVQTSFNSRLRQDTNEPFLASGISFLVGTIFLNLFGVITGGAPFLTGHELGLIPWWGYLGGLLATICLTANIFMFDVLGSVLAIVLPMVGQIIFSLLIDSFGWLGTKVIPLSWARISGAILVIIGIIFIVVLPTLHQRGQKQEHHVARMFWTVGGLISGVVYATELAINGRVGAIVHSPIHAAFLTFAIATALLFLFVAGRGHIQRITLLVKQRTPWWALLGGVIGGFSIYLGAFLVPQIGNGSAIVLGILGQIAVSMLIDTFGLLGGKKRPLTLAQFLGLVIMVAGVVLIEPP